MLESAARQIPAGWRGPGRPRAEWTPDAPESKLVVAGQAAAGAGEKTGPSRKVRTPQGRVVGKPDPGKPAGKCHRDETAQAAGTHVPPSPARVKGCGKSAPASRRRGASRQTPPGARPSRDVDAARRVPGRPQGVRPAPKGGDGWLL